MWKCKQPVIFLALDPAKDGGAAANELRLHNTALLSFIDFNTSLYRAATPINYIVCIDKWSFIMRF
jgi:hypothetical protein